MNTLMDERWVRRRFFGGSQEETASPVGSDKVAEEEGEDLEDEEEYDEEEEEEDEDRPRKKPRHGGFILDEAGEDTSVVHFSCQQVAAWCSVLPLRCRCGR